MKSRSRPGRAASTDDGIHLDCKAELDGDGGENELTAALGRARYLGARVWLKLSISGWVLVYAQRRRGQRPAGRPHYRAAPIDVAWERRLPELLGTVLDLLEREREEEARA